MSFNINNLDGMNKFIKYLENNEDAAYFKEKEEGVLVPVTFAEFDALDDTHKQSVYDKLEGVIKQIGSPPAPASDGTQSLSIPSDQTLSKILEIRNQIFYSLNKSDWNADIPKEIVTHIQSYAAPKDTTSSIQVSKSWEISGTEARNEQINRGTPLREVVPPNIKSATEAIEWLKQNIDCTALSYADFRGFADLDEINLKEFIEICPHLSHLFIQTDQITHIETLPSALQTFDCSFCRFLKELPPLPSTLQKLKCSFCTIKELPELKPPLQELDISNCKRLYQLLQLPATLQKLDCSSSTIKDLPELPSELQELNCSKCGNFNKLPALQNTLLQRLDCHGCPINQLPELPPTLQELDCGFCKNLNPLPELNSALKKLKCHSCPIKELPMLPNTLQELNCDKCENLKGLPALTSALQSLDCNDCPIEELPKLPLSLVRLSCNGCQNLRNLPDLPDSLRGLYCNDCPIKELPALPNTLQTLQCFTCPLEQESIVRAAELWSRHSPW